MSDTHTTSTGCRVSVRRLGPMTEIVVVQKDGRAQTFACSPDDAHAIGILLLRVPKDGETRDAPPLDEP